MTLARGLDVCGWYQDPADMDFQGWKKLGFCYLYYQVAIGLRPTPLAQEHRAKARAAGWLTGPYLEMTKEDGAAQARLLIKLRGEGDELPDMAAYEYSLEVQLHLLVNVHDALSPAPLVLYTGGPVWTREVVVPGKAARYAGYPLLLAGYPFDTPQGQPAPMDWQAVARRSTPDLAHAPKVIAPWGRWWAWQHSGQGSLPGYKKFLDLEVHSMTEAELRAAYAAPFKEPIVPQGATAVPYIGTPGQSIALYRAAAQAGRPYRLAVILNDGGVAEDLHSMDPVKGGCSPDCLTFVRYYNPEDDSLQGLDDWTLSQRTEWCRRVLAKIYANITPSQLPHITWAGAWNEEDPPGPFGYRDLGETFLLLMGMNEARKLQGLSYVKLALLCLSQGTPEYWEMQQLVDTGMFEKAAELGYAIVFHEGVFRGEPIDKGYQVALASTRAKLDAKIFDMPAWPGSGAECFRFVWITEAMLRARGKPVPPVIIGEWYDGGTVHGDIASRLAAWTWYDERASQYPYFVGFAGFACWLPGWEISDLSDVYESKLFDQWRAARAQRKNGGAQMPYYTDAQVALLRGQFNGMIAAANTGLALLDAGRVFKAGDVVLATVDPFNLYSSAAATTPVAVRHNYQSTDQTVLAVSADGLRLKVFAAPEYWVNARDVKLKGT
jgi:GH25 family lysozyme M1 (1,4-beta-N-acetylmuramidase)